MFIHLAARFYPYLVLSSIPVVWVPHLPPFTSLALLAAGVVLSGVLYRHAGHPCLYCAEGMPLDGPGEAFRRRIILRAGHYTVVPAGCLAAVILLWSVADMTGVTHRDTTPDRALRSLSIALSALVCLGLWEHDRLSPWCPWCRHGRHRDHDTQPVNPAPEPAGH